MDFGLNGARVFCGRFSIEELSMNNVAARARLTALGVGALALLMGVGYLAEKGFGQLYAPIASANEPPPSNRSRWDNSPQPRNPIPDRESIWEDYPDSSLTNKARLSERPGNFELLKKVGQFFEDIYAVEPTMKELAFPFYHEDGTSRSSEAAEKAAKAKEAQWRAEGSKQQNGMRRYNIVIRRATFLRFAAGESSITNPAEYGLNDKRIDKFSMLRKDHPERCWLVLVRAAWESLQSDKVEFDNREADFIFCYVWKPEGWRLAWFEKG